MKSVRTETQLLAEALQVQDACNLSGVVHSFSRALTDLWAIADHDGEGTDWVNQHPVSVLFADKIKHLSGLDHKNDVFDAYQVAHDLTAGMGACNG